MDFLYILGANFKKSSQPPASIRNRKPLTILFSGVIKFSSISKTSGNCGYVCGYVSLGANRNIYNEVLCDMLSTKFADKTALSDFQPQRLTLTENNHVNTGVNFVHSTV